MHHYSTSASRVEMRGESFLITLTNKMTGAEITLSGPRKGIFENERRSLDGKTAQRLCRGLADVLRNALTSEGETPRAMGAGA